jgi:hypothetical protein
LAQMIAKGRELLVLGFAELSGGSSFRTGWHKDFAHESPNLQTQYVHRNTICNQIWRKSLFCDQPVQVAQP